MELIILTPHGEAFRGEVQSVTLPGVAGRLTVLAHHAPLITALTAGAIVYRTAEGGKEVVVKNGFAEVNHNVVSVCAEQ